jgi:hypothetical protein
VLSSQYGSFSVFGLSFTYILGLLIITASFAIEPILDSCLGRAQRNQEQAEGERIDANSYRHLEWITNEMLQQQRLAQEELGWGGKRWKNSTGYIPIPTEGEAFGSLDVTDPHHPVLHSPAVARDMKLARGRSAVDLGASSSENRTDTFSVSSLYLPEGDEDRSGPAESISPNSPVRHDSVSDLDMQEGHNIELTRIATPPTGAVERSNSIQHSPIHPQR